MNGGLVGQVDFRFRDGCAVCDYARPPRLACALPEVCGLRARDSVCVRCK